MNRHKRRARCHTPTKDVYYHQAEAERAARNASANYGWPIEAYECSSCLFWHITKVKRR